MTSDLMTEFRRIESITDTKQRGREFEVFLTRIFEKENITFKGRYRPKGEEIDGAIFLHGRNYLIEAKWREKKEPASSVYEFRGKIEGKFAGTVGIFWSINGYSKNCVPTVMAGKTLNVILFDRSDLDAILDGSITFKELLEEKLMLAGTYGLIFVPWSDMEESDRIRKETEEVYPNIQLMVVVEGSYDVDILLSLISYCFDQDKRQPLKLLTIPAGGKQGVIVRAPVYAMSLFSSPNMFCIVMMDRDADTDKAIERFRNKLSNVAGKNERNLYLAVPNPNIWEWLGLDSSLPKPNLKEILKQFDWGDAISKHPDLRELADFIRKIN